MDTLVDTLIIASVVVVISWMITRTVGKYFEMKAAKSRQMAAVRRGGASRTRETPRELAPWVEELLNQVGHSVDDLYEDEMPDDLVELLRSPLVKSFLGGLQGGGKTEGDQPGTGGWV